MTPNENGTSLTCIGGLCSRGNGHIWFFDDEESASSCGGKSWPVYIQVMSDEWDDLPTWVRERADGVL